MCDDTAALSVYVFNPLVCLRLLGLAAGEENDRQRVHAITLTESHIRRAAEFSVWSGKRGVCVRMSSKQHSSIFSARRKTQNVLERMNALKTRSSATSARAQDRILSPEYLIYMRCLCVYQQWSNFDQYIGSFRYGIFEISKITEFRIWRIMIIYVAEMSESRSIVILDFSYLRDAYYTLNFIHFDQPKRCSHGAHNREH